VMLDEIKLDGDILNYKAPPMSVTTFFA